MSDRIRIAFWKYKWEILLLLAYAGILFYCSPLDITQVNLGDKGALLLYQSLSLDLASKYPLYSLLGWMVTRFPMMDGMAMSIFLSLIPAVLSCVFVYLIVLRETSSRLSAVVGSLVLMSSSVYFLQAQKVEPYCLAGFLLILGCWFKDRKWTSSIIFGLSMLVHVFAFLMIAMLCTLKDNVEMRKKTWLIFGILVVVWSIIILSQKEILSISIISDAMSIRGNWSLTVERIVSIVTGLPMILSFGFLTSSVLLFKRRDDYFYFVVVTFFILIAHFFTVYPGINIISIYLPVFAASSGVGSRYINMSKFLLFCCCLLISFNVFNFNLRVIDNYGDTTSVRSMINQLSSLKDGSRVLFEKMYRGKIIQDGFNQAGAVKYCNYKYDKKLVLCEIDQKEYYYFELIDLNNFYSVLMKKNSYE